MMQELTASASQDDEIERQILRDYKYDASVPSSHAYAMASVGDEAMSGYDSLILAQDEAHRRRVVAQRQSGGDAQKQNSRYRAKRIIEKNQAMIEEFLQHRGVSIATVAKKNLG